MKIYQIYIRLSQDSKIIVGKLGEFLFPKGFYIYTGSAKKNIDARIARHQSQEKKMHWHIDYFLSNKSAEIVGVRKFSSEECQLNQSTNGKIIVPGFGSSDCKNKCGSHLKMVDDLGLN